MRLHSEEQVCPRRKNLYTPERVLSGGQSERGGHRFWDTEQRERGPASRGNSCIASEPKRPVEASLTFRSSFFLSNGTPRDVLAVPFSLKINTSTTSNLSYAHNATTVRSWEASFYKNPMLCFGGGRQ
jgi:hypothetical protein